jgi:hypothetical protein
MSQFELEQFKALYNEMAHRMLNAGISRKEIAHFLLNGAFGFMEGSIFSEEEREDIIFNASYNIQPCYEVYGMV